MEYAQVGKHAMTACRWCDLPITCKVDGPADGIRLLTEMLSRHIECSTSCRKQQEALPSMAELQTELAPAFAKSAAEREKRLAENQDNGTLGWWRVEGVRHDAVARAISAGEAVEKANKAGIVGDWESAEATFMGEELPDVF